MQPLKVSSSPRHHAALVNRNTQHAGSPSHRNSQHVKSASDIGGDAPDQDVGEDDKQAQHKSAVPDGHQNRNVHNIAASSGRYRKITLDAILAATSLTRSTKETHEAYLQRVTHLHLQAKRIRTIDGLELCTNLKVLYLYDNQIDLIQNLDFATLLQYLYLQNNQIKEIPPLNMPNLRKLFLDDNSISYLTGLNACGNLEELRVARQKLPNFSSLQFDAASLNAISGSLLVIDVSGNGITKLIQFSCLTNLRKFICKNNGVVDLNEAAIIVGISNLEEANFIGNPITKLSKYRDHVIGTCAETFAILDELPIPKHQQVAIKGLMMHRRKIGVVSKFRPENSMTENSNYEPQELLESSEESLGGYPH